MQSETHTTTTHHQTMARPVLGPINESLSSDSPIEAIGDDDSERTTAGVACSSSSVLSSSSRSSVLSSYISDDRKLVDDEERRESESLPESAREEEIGPENRPLHNKDDGDLQVLVQGIKTCKGSSALTDSPFNGNWLHLDKRVRNLQNRGRDDVFLAGPYLCLLSHLNQTTHGRRTIEGI